MKKVGSCSAHKIYVQGWQKAVDNYPFCSRLLSGPTAYCQLVYLLHKNIKLLKKFVNLIFFGIIFLGLNNSIGQTPTEHPSGKITVMAVVIDGDTMLMRNLPMVLIKEKRTFKSRRQAIRYTRLVRNVKKVYPYSQAAASLLKQYNDQLALIEDPKKRKRLMKQAEKELKAEYGAELRQLTFSQGMILIKLIDRETGHTSYELVKDLRGGFSAFLWQSFSRLFGINLKTRYNSDGEDQRIEDIVLLIKRGEI